MQAPLKAQSDGHWARAALRHLNLDQLAQDGPRLPRTLPPYFEAQSDGDAVRGEGRSLIRSTKGRDRYPFVVQRYGHLTWVGIVDKAFIPHRAPPVTMAACTCQRLSIERAQPWAVMTSSSNSFIAEPLR